MRYNIIRGQVKESIFIDAPYDTKQDAQHDIDNEKIWHACHKCDQVNNLMCDDGIDNKGE
jgi:hypothetical protein